MPAIATGIRGQTHLDDFMNFGGTITAGGTAQLLLPQQPRRTSIYFVNTSATDTLYLGIGPATATATIASGQVTAITANNAGLGYTIAPRVVILGGLVAGDLQSAPSHPASAHVPLSSGSIGTFVIDDPGAGYVVAPTIYLMNSLPQLGGGAWAPNGASTPKLGIPVAPASYWSASGILIVPTSALAVWGATTGDSFECIVGGLV